MMFVPWKAVNNEGMTFEEWFNAANCFDPQAVDIDIGYQAWAAGHDPTEYAAAGGNTTGDRYEIQTRQEV